MKGNMDALEALLKNGRVDANAANIVRYFCRFQCCAIPNICCRLDGIILQCVCCKLLASERITLL